ncbi:hypothetical protein [Thermodesulforhabdus norvegica]|uniref:Lipoprotein n=1 Tax=Thermodesulforhabdus norvegica TaxID=39841 RepID=A0A1I4SNF0_9BACT|nr:hypothetical protein [Thermodesulforhabdus norvegica]SFM65890.1 hypothetical protein SAMN05660836_01065 [Thermodesulforhabdus norvegica]
MRKFTVALIALFCAGCVVSVPPVQKDPSEVIGRPPEIVDSFTYSRIPSGRILPIFVDAEDKDGDLVGFWVTVSQLGGNMFSRHYIPLKEGKGSRIVGFMTIDVPRLYNVEYLRIEMSAVDAEGNRSNMVTHSVEIGMVSSVREKVPEKWKGVGGRRIGHIFFDFERESEGEEENFLRR